MKIHLLAGIAGALLLSGATGIYAADHIADPVVVTATRTAQTADETLASVTVLGREQILAAGARDIADILRLQAGIEIARNGGPGQPASLFLRGTDSNHTLVLLDGVRINPGTIGGAPLENLDPELVERIEIVRGPRSTLYGSDAIGGVVHIFTRREKTGVKRSVRLEGGSDDTRSVGASLMGGRNGLRGGIDIGYIDSDGFPTRTTSGLDRGHDNRSASLYAGYAGGGWDLELSHWRAEGNTEYVDFFLAPLDQDFEDSVTALTITPPSRGIWSSTFKASRMENDIRQQQDADFVRTRRTILDWQNDIAVNAHHLLTAGVYLLREDTDSLSFGTSFDEDTDVNALFLQDHFRLGKHRVVAGVRYTDHEGFGDHDTWNVAYGYRISGATRLFASVGTGFRAPDATDRFGFGGNPDLDPETSRNIEFGVQHRIDRAQTLHVTAFHNRIDDLVVFNDPDGFSGPAAGRNENLDEARIRGIEAEYTLALERLSARVSATVQDPENDDTGEDLARRAERFVSAMLGYRFARLYGELEWIASSERQDSDFSDVELGGYGVVNLNLRIPVKKGISVQGKIENLFDKEYFHADGFRSQDRAVYLTLRYQPDA